MSDLVEFEKDYTVRQESRGVYTMFPNSDPEYAVAQALELGIVIEFTYVKDYFTSKAEVSTALKFMQSKVPWPTTRKWVIE